MIAERPRARRYNFAASVELIDTETEAVVRERTCDLSLFGCLIRAAKPWAIGRKVHVKINYKGSAFNSFGQVAHAQNNGMGVQFARVAPKDGMILEIWMAELRNGKTV